MIDLLPRSSVRAHAEALWKQEGAKFFQFLRNPAHGARRGESFKRRECRRNTQPSAVVHASFAMAHNLKAAGSNPAPATKSSRNIKVLNVERFACV
jgi:hypothetical protein